jgi:hypothetical protein
VQVAVKSPNLPGARAARDGVVARAEGDSIMRKILTTAALAGSLAVALTACKAEVSESPAPEGDAPAADTDTGTEAACACDKGKAGETVWCGDCGKGYVDGKEKACEGCVTGAIAGTPCPT